MNVLVEQDLCTGFGLCEEHCPSVFVLEDSLAYVRSATGHSHFAGGSAGLALIAAVILDDVIDPAEECPGECIFVEV